MTGHMGCFIRTYVRNKSFLSILMYMNHFFNTHIVRKNRLNKCTYEEKLQVKIRILKRNNCCLNSYVFSYVYMIGAMFLSNFLKLSGKFSCNRVRLKSKAQHSGQQPKGLSTAPLHPAPRPPHLRLQGKLCAMSPAPTSCQAGLTRRKDSELL